MGVAVDWDGRTIKMDKCTCMHKTGLYSQYLHGMLLLLVVFLGLHVNNEFIKMSFGIKSIPVSWHPT